jgi:hypothetical protein
VRVAFWGPPTRQLLTSVAAVDELSDEARLELRLAKRRKFQPLRVAPVADLASYLPAPDAGWGEARREAVAIAVPEAPRRSTRARADRTYADGEDEEDLERSASPDDE